MTASGSRASSPDFLQITATGVSRYYGRRRALAKASFACVAGTITGLFGPNGAGKSTLLGILSTLIEPSRGTVQYGTSTSADQREGLRARIGVLGHDLFLYPELTARENLEFFGRLHGVDDLAGRIARAFEAARLVDRADDRTAGFSRGLRQRLALERALLHEPRLVLLDEPFTGLDDASSRVLLERLSALRASGAIVVMATHDFETADGIVDQALCVDEGRVRAVSAGPGTLRERYRRSLAGGLPA